MPSELSFAGGLIIGMMIAMIITHAIDIMNRFVNRTFRLCDRCSAELRHDH